MTKPTQEQPRVRGNDWPTLDVPALGAWTPSKSVSVVIPAHGASCLPLVLGALAVQTYPEHLLEVVVVDDGSDPPIKLPADRPERTRLVHNDGHWGQAAARHTGALAAEGEVLHWLDADMLLHRDAVEAQLRWHHLIDYAVVLGYKRFVDTGESTPDLDQVLAAVADGSADTLFPDAWQGEHDWVEEHLAKTEQLTRNPTRSYLVHVGATASVRRDLYLSTGGMHPELKLAEDVELGYRLAQAGAVFVPDREARSWHLGRSTLMADERAVNRFNRPFVTDRVPDLRHWRTPGRAYTVPWLQVVVDATGHDFEAVRHSVTGALTGNVADVEVLVVGPWSALGDERRSPLTEPLRDARMVQAEFVGEPRVRLVEEVPASAFPAAFRVHLPAGWAPARKALSRLAREMNAKDRGLLSLLLPDGGVARLERTSAFQRAALVRGPGEELDDAVDAVSGTWWHDGLEEGFRHVDDPGDTEVTAYRPEKARAHRTGGRKPPTGERQATPASAGRDTSPATSRPLAAAAGRRSLARAARRLRRRR